MAIPSLLGSQKYTSPTAELNPTVNLPASSNAGELLIMQIWTSDPTVTISTPAGWSLADQLSSTAGQSYIFSRVADGTEGATVALTSNGSTTFGAFVLRTDATSVDAITNDFSVFASAAISPDAITTVDECLIIRTFAIVANTLKFNASLTPANITSILFESTASTPTDSDFVSFQAAEETAAIAGAVGTTAWLNVWGGGKFFEHTIALSGAPSGFDTEPESVTRGETGIVLNSSAGGLGTSQGAGTALFGGQAVTVTAWSDTSITVDIPTNIALQHDALGYQFAVTPDGSGTILSNRIPFLQQSSYNYTSLINPDTSDNKSIVFGYTGDAPVTGDQIVFEAETNPDTISVTVTAEGYVTLSTTPAQTQTISRYVIQADGTPGAEDVYTLEVDAAGIAPTMPADANVTVVENAMVLGTFAATAGTAPITYALSGVDATSFDVDANTGAVTFASTPDYETKTSCSFTITATNTAGSDSQIITVAITNVLEQSITIGGDITLPFPYGTQGLAHDDQSLLDWLASYTEATSNTLSSLPNPLTVDGNPYLVTFFRDDAPSVSGLLTVVQAGGVESDAIIADFKIYPGFTVKNYHSLFPYNTHVAEVSSTLWAINGTPINDASVSLTLRSGGVELLGQTWPTPMVPILGEPGRYRAVLSHQIDYSSVSNDRVDGELLIEKGLSRAQYNYNLKVKARDK